MAKHDLQRVRISLIPQIVNGKRVAESVHIDTRNLSSITQCHQYPQQSRAGKLPALDRDKQVISSRVILSLC